MAIALGRLNQLPTDDGAITPYLWPTLKGKAPSLHSRKLIYVNGMATTQTAHKIAAESKAKTTKPGWLARLA